MPETENDSRPLFRLFPTFGLRLALWYATLFVIGSIVIVVMTYWLTSASLAQRDRQILESKLGQYATVYQGGGLGAVADTVRSEQRTAPERVLFVRVVNRGGEAIVLSQPESWDPQQLETASLRLLGRHAGASGEEHRGPRRPARCDFAPCWVWSRSRSS